MNTGHVKQIATFEKLVEFCNAHGSSFNPSKVSIQLTSLNGLLTSAQQALTQVKAARTDYETAINTRNDAFDALPKFMTRVVNSLAATDATGATLQDAYRIIRKMRSGKKAASEPSELNATDEPKATRSKSQLDFDSRTDNVEAFVKLIGSEPSYQPNEVDLTIAALKAYTASLRQLNTNVIQAQVALSNARANRDKVLYGKGIHRSALSVKRYIKGVYGFQSAPYQQVRGLKFSGKKT